MYVHEQMFQMVLLLFKENTCAKLFEIHAYIYRSYGPEKLIYVTFKCDLDLQPTSNMFQMILFLLKDNNCVK